MTVGFEPTADQLECYLDRIGLAQRPPADAAGLIAVHRHHVEAVSWENLDMHLGRITTTDVGAAYRKIVEQRRGGWCYEMNGLLGVMLQALGFSVRRLAAGVMREMHGDSVIGNHLALIVELDQPWLADLGLGSGLIEPVPLREGAIEQAGRQFRLERLDGNWWRFHNAPGSMPPSFDFDPAFSDDALLVERCHWLQTDPGSPFAGTPVVQRYRQGRLHSLIRGRLVQANAGDGAEHDLRSATDLNTALLRQFDLEIEDAEAIWRLCQPRIAAV